MPASEPKIFYPKTRQQWRQWLQKNHDRETGVLLKGYRKEMNKPSLATADAVEEALCFGWIDSIKRKLEDGSSVLKFTPRKTKSIWSKVNKDRVNKLIENGLMTEAGLAKISLAKSNGSWDSLNASDHHAANNSIPPELEKAFTKNKKALANFQAFPSSYRKRFLYWIDSAKRPETKKERIIMTVKMSAANKKPGVDGFKM